MPGKRSILLLLALTAATQSAAAQSRFAVHLFGLSYHYKSRTYRDWYGNLRHYEQVNVGVGAEYLMRSTDRTLISFDAGAYRDSKDRLNVFAGPAMRLKFGTHLLAGAGVVLLTSRTYGTPIAPLPVVTARWGWVALNGTWMPSLDSRESGAVAMFGTVYLPRRE